jgi:hypothetical protein
MPTFFSFLVRLHGKPKLLLVLLGSLAVVSLVAGDPNYSSFFFFVCLVFHPMMIQQKPAAADG